jgi:uncharacterized protein YdhG (YjbR/CyaY superfamily)
MMSKSYNSVDEYIRTFPKEVQDILENIRHAIRMAAPEAEEVISYQIPAFKLNGNLVYFAGWKNHVAFYPSSSAIKMFSEELSSYETTKGTIKFPLDKPIPFGLIAEITKFRVKENLARKNKKKIKLKLSK